MAGYTHESQIQNLYEPPTNEVGDQTHRRRLHAVADRVISAAYKNTPGVQNLINLTVRSIDRSSHYLMACSCAVSAAVCGLMRFLTRRALLCAT